MGSKMYHLKLTKKRIVYILLILVSFFLLGCENNEPTSAISINSPESSLINSFDKSPNFPQQASTKVRFWNNNKGYREANANVPSGSKFHIEPSSLTPPSEIGRGEDVYVTMNVEKDPIRNQLIFTFGPHNCQFDPPAEVTLDWTVLGMDVANLYYINEDGSYVLQEPDLIDIQNRKLTIKVPHFSRYAIGEMR